jgi:Tfp pilus assembly protein PilV
MVRNNPMKDIVAKASGFTLFETLAATMILAIALVVILQLFSGGMRAGHLSDMYTQAVWHAQEKMDEILLMHDIVNPASDGQWEDGFTWQANIVAQDPQKEAEADGSLRPYAVTVQVRWAEGPKERDVTLKCITLAREPADGTQKQ